MKLIQKIKRIFTKDKNQDFFTLRKLRSHLPVNLFIDDVGAWYDKKNDTYILKVQNDTNDIASLKHCLSVTISDKPKVLDPSEKIKISDTHLNNVFKFIKTNKEQLILLAKCDIDIFDFFDSFEAM